MVTKEVEPSNMGFELLPILDLSTRSCFLLQAGGSYKITINIFFKHFAINNHTLDRATAGREYYTKTFGIPPC